MDKPEKHTQTFYTIFEKSDRYEGGFTIQEALQYKSGWRIGRTKQAPSIEAARALIPTSKTRKERGHASPMDVVEWWF